jgi:hypothetical protein
MDYAANRGHLEIVKWLHENRPEVSLKDSLACAAYCGRLTVVKWMVEHLNPADVDIAVKAALVEAKRVRQWVSVLKSADTGKRDVVDFLQKVIDSRSNA